MWLLQEAYELGRWMHLSYANGSKADCPAFTPPSAADGTETEKKLKQEKVSILQRLAAQEAEMQQLLADLEAGPLQGPGRRGHRLPNCKPPRSRASRSPTPSPSTRRRPAAA